MMPEIYSNQSRPGSNLVAILGEEYSTNGEQFIFHFYYYLIPQLLDTSMSVHGLPDILPSDFVGWVHVWIILD
jgi:hypothetical protein